MGRKQPRAGPGAAGPGRAGLLSPGRRSPTNPLPGSSIPGPPSTAPPAPVKGGARERHATAPGLQGWDANPQPCAGPTSSGPPRPSGGGSQACPAPGTQRPGMQPAHASLSRTFSRPDRGAGLTPAALPRAPPASAGPARRPHPRRHLLLLHP